MWFWLVAWFVTFVRLVSFVTYFVMSFDRLLPIFVISFVIRRVIDTCVLCVNLCAHLMPSADFRRRLFTIGLYAQVYLQLMVWFYLKMSKTCILTCHLKHATSVDLGVIHWFWCRLLLVHLLDWPMTAYMICDVSYIRYMLFGVSFNVVWFHILIYLKKCVFVTTKTYQTSCRKCDQMPKFTPISAICVKSVSFWFVSFRLIVCSSRV